MYDAPLALQGEDIMYFSLMLSVHAHAIQSVPRSSIEEPLVSFNPARTLPR